VTVDSRIERLHPFWEDLVRTYGGDYRKIYKATGLLPPVSGGAGPGPEGYNETADILTRTVDGVDLNELYEEIMATLRILNAQRAPLIEWLTFPVTEPFEEIMPAVTEDFEEADEFGQPVGIRLGPPWNMGYDLKYFDLGIRYTFRYLGRAPAKQIRALNNTALDADQRLLLKTVLTQLFNNTNRTATLESTGTVVTVRPFYNGTVTALPVAPPSWKSYVHTTTHMHYLSSGAATVTFGDLDEMYDHIYHHGYVASGVELFLLVPRKNAKTIRTFRVAGGATYDFFPVVGSVEARMFGTLIGALPSVAAGKLDGFPGHIGDYGPIHVIEEDLIPDDYMILIASGGSRDTGNPIGLREHENEALRGLKLIPQFERYPLRESFYHHAVGSGTRYPGKGVVMKVTAGAYDIPSLNLGGPGGR
jgi:hypothetical protein